MPGKNDDRKMKTGGQDHTKTGEKRKAEDREVDEQDVLTGGKSVRICEPELDMISDEGDDESEGENETVEEVDILASGLEENDSDSDHHSQQDEGSSEEFEEEDGDGLLSFLDVGFRRCSQEIVRLRKENRYLKRQLEESQKKSFAKVAKVCPPAGEENNPIVVAGKVLPILCARGYVKLDNLLKCRLVCRNWRPEVDHFLETPFSSREFDKKERQLEERRWAFKVLPDVSKDETDKLGQAYKFHCPSRLQEFLGKFEDFEGNPFLGRIAHFKVTEDNLRKYSDNDPEDEVKLYWKLVVKLLKKFGEHLWYVTINQDELGLTPLQLYKLLGKILPLVKNVRCLEVYGKYEEVLLKTESQSDLSRYKYQNPLPRLPCLRSLDFHFPTASILDTILNINPSLSNLTVFYANVDLRGIGFSVCKLPLKELTWFTRPYKYMNNIFSFPGNLEKLYVDFTSTRSNSGQIKLSELLRGLRKFPKLCEVKLKGTIGLDQKGWTLKFMSIETLTLLNCYGHDYRRGKNRVLEDLKKRDGFYAQIMFHFPNLRFLYIEDKRKANSATALRLEYDEDLVWEFDVWEEFKSLEAIDLKTTYHIATATTTASEGTRGKTRTNRFFWRR